MKIIQSFARYDEVTPYLKMRKGKKDYYYLNFYSMLLSYITLQQQYGSVTMFCNQEAYDSIIKYIPYDKVEIVENQNDFMMWSKYILDIMKLIGEDFIHVDQDVFIFDDFYRPFIEGKCDVLVQDVISKGKNDTKQFVFENLDYLKDTKILTKTYDGQGFSCGSVGLTKEVQEYYFAGVDVLYDGMKKFGIEEIAQAAMILEETLLYLITYENDFSYHDIIPQKDVDKLGLLYAGDKIGYAHLWAKNKFKKVHIQDVRNKLLNDFSDFQDNLLKFEREVMFDKKIYEYIVKDKS